LLQLLDLEYSYIVAEEICLAEGEYLAQTQTARGMTDAAQLQAWPLKTASIKCFWK
jgi:hypothetical protein